jgi:two-component system chemotaxis response regulator CheB
MTLAPGDLIRLDPCSPADRYRPSCDRLLHSVAAIGARAIGLILTGMGRDGARGMAAIAAAGGVTLAQDEATSVVFGMNREAILAGGIQRVLPLEAIAGELIRLAECMRRPLVKRAMVGAGA